jgi:polysaccharide biosynthesis transport protein
VTLEEALRALWRRKWIVVLTVLIVTLATYLVSRGLPEVYSSDATLYVKDTGEAANDFEAIQSAQVLAKTYAELIQSENVANDVAVETPGEETGGELLEKMSFEPLPDTQLVVITAEASSAEGAADLANTYASVFTDFVSEDQLGPEIEGKVTIADPATIPTSPVRPRPALYAAVAGLLGVFLGAGLALLRDRLDTRLGTSEELSAALGVPVLALVPEAAAHGPPSEPIREESFAEAMRVLYANLRFVSRGKYPASVLITSPGAGEGKSTVCMGLASALAEHGSEVIVLEGDLRRPALSEDGQRHPAGTYGLSTVLEGHEPLQRELELIVKTPAPGVQVLPAGTRAQNPSALLQPESVERLLKVAGEMTEMVIIDSPPLTVGPDAMLLSRPAEATVLVVNQRRTSRPAALRAMQQLNQAGARVIGVVVNAVPGGERDHYSYGRERARRRATPTAAVPGGPRRPA